MFNYILGFVAIITLPLAKGTVQACIDTFQAGKCARAFYEGFKKEWTRTEQRPVPTIADIDLDLPSYEELFAVTDGGIEDEPTFSKDVIDGDEFTYAGGEGSVGLYSRLDGYALVLYDMTSRQLRAALETLRDEGGYKPPKSISRMTKAEMLEQMLTLIE